MTTASLPCLWVKAEPFNYGTLPIPPPPRLSVNCIKKSLAYAKNKGELGFPRISYAVWRHIACNKIHLSEDLAWLYFSMCHLLCENIPPAERIEWSRTLAQCPTHHEKVNSSTSDLDIKMRRSKAMDEHNHLVFVQNHLMDMFELLVDPENRGNSSSLSRDVEVSVDIVEALGFLICGSTDKFRTLTPLQDIVRLQSVRPKTGFLKVGQSFQVQQLYHWIKGSLVQNPFGISRCISAGRRLSWLMVGEEVRCEGNFKRGRIATNAHIVPKEHVIGNKIIILSQVNKQTVTRCSSTLENSSVKIHRCHGSFLYLLSPLRSITIEKCRHSKIVLGPVAVTIHVNHCQSVTVIAPCWNIVVSNSQLCTLHLLTSMQPVLLGGNDTIELAPYHTHYAKLEEHMEKMGLDTRKNVWDQPLCLGPDSGAPVWELMKPEEFFTFNIPFEMEGKTVCVPGELPKAYRDVMAQRQRQVINWQKLVKEAKLAAELQSEFQDLVENHFSIWLSENGFRRELESLALPVS